MANAGPNTNKSQLYVSIRWIDLANNSNFPSILVSSHIDHRKD